jgi:hypothetical protein
LDRNSVASIAARSISRVGQLLVEDELNFGCHAARRHQWVPENGLALLSGSETASVFARIENRVFAKT